MAAEESLPKFDSELTPKVLLPPDIRSAFASAISGKGVELPENAAGIGAANDITNSTEGATLPTTPLLVFINSRSGGHMGPALYANLSQLISKAQVFDLSKAKPNVVIPAVIECLAELSQNGNSCAQTIRERLRIVVAGGDGTVGWMLSVLEDVPSPPPVAVIPLGTGNDLSRMFGWGPTFASPDVGSLKKRLLEASEATSHNLDSWAIKVIPSPDLDISQMKLPYSMKKTDVMEEGENRTAFVGAFWNYFSLGMDAEVAYSFHHLRDTKPWLASSRNANKMIYANYGCTQGWFCAPCGLQSSTKKVNMVTRVSIMTKDGGEWEEISIANKIRALVIMNIQSYAGGTDPWGKPSAAENEKSGWSKAVPDDGKAELVGLRDGWHSLFLLMKTANAARLNQVYGVRFELRGEHNPNAFLQIDGEPWKQGLSVEGTQPTIVQVTRKKNPSVMLATAGAKVLTD